MTYQEWNAARREVFGAIHESYDNIEVVHGDYETGLYYGGADGRLVAVWEQSTGRCRIDTVKQVAEDISRDVRNYIINAASGE